MLWTAFIITNEVNRTREEVLSLVKLVPKYKFWLETEDGYVFGLGSFKLLQGIQDKGTLTASAKELNMSYRHAWGIIKQIQEKVGQAIVITHKGGKDGGGGSELTPLGKELLLMYLRYQKAFNEISKERTK